MANYLKIGHQNKSELMVCVNFERDLKIRVLQNHALGTCVKHIHCDYLIEFCQDEKHLIYLQHSMF